MAKTEFNLTHKAGTSRVQNLLHVGNVRSLQNGQLHQRLVGHWTFNDVLTGQKLSFSRARDF